MGSNKIINIGRNGKISGKQQLDFKLTLDQTKTPKINRRENKER